MYRKHPERKFFFAEKRHHYLFKSYDIQARLDGVPLINYYVKTNDIPVVLFLLKQSRNLNEDILKFLILNLIQDKYQNEIIQTINDFVNYNSPFYSCSLDLILNWGNKSILHDLANDNFTKLIKIFLNKKNDKKANQNNYSRIKFNSQIGKLSIEKSPLPPRGDISRRDAGVDLTTPKFIATCK
jgi:hypothetical protein